MPDKPPILLDYRTPLPPPPRGPIPDGYLGHRANPDERSQWEYESVELGPLGWVIVVMLVPIITITLAALMLWRF
jgi:hypothetical protein